MASLRLTYAGEEHVHGMESLRTRLAQPPGIGLNSVVVGVPELFRRQLCDAEFESSEMSLSTFAMLVSDGIDTFVGVPVLTARRLRHRDVYVNVGAGIERPEELVGKRVGVSQYGITAAVWIRAFLQHDYGVTPTDVRWFHGRLNTPGARTVSPEGGSRRAPRAGDAGGGDLTAQLRCGTSAGPASTRARVRNGARRR